MSFWPQLFFQLHLRSKNIYKTTRRRGFAGKSTLINYILKAQHGCRCAVLLNEIGDSADVERALIKEPEVCQAELCKPAGFAFLCNQGTHHGAVRQAERRDLAASAGILALRCNSCCLT